MTIKFISLANGSLDHEAVGKYLKSYNADVHRPDGGYDGGALRLSDTKEDALWFPDLTSATRAWQSGPSCHCHSLRPDGRPNRPLTAFTVEIS